MIRTKVNQSHGNKFVQLIHDGCTLDNGDKVQSIGLQFVDPKFRTNHIYAYVVVSAHREKATVLHNLSRRSQWRLLVKI